MSTSIEGRVLRALGPETFADLTDAALLEVSPGGLLFAGTLTDAEVFAIHDRMTSRDDEDQVRRDLLRDLAPECPCCASLIAYVLGDPLPDVPA